MTRPGVVLAAALTAAALTGCGGPSSPAPAVNDPPLSSAPPAPTSAPPSNACADAAAPVPLPTSFPRTVPLPPDAVPTTVEERSAGRLIVTAVTPRGFRQTLAFMQHAYPAAGLTLGEGEVEDRDAESNFTGAGLTGRWTLREMPGCDGDTQVTILVTRT